MIKELEGKIKTLKSRIELSREQLLKHESGNITLTHLAQASAEESINQNIYLLNSLIEKMNKLDSKEIQKLQEEEKRKVEVRKKNYFKYQTHRIKRDKTKTHKEKDEIFFIMDDLSDEIQLDDTDIFEISRESTLLYLKIHSEINDEFQIIKTEFLELVNKNCDVPNDEFKLLNHRIPIIVLQLRVLLQNIKENIQDETLDKFKGLPKFQDWWIEELWTSHQAYMALFKWKQIILSLFISDEQKKAFETIFKNWILIKKILNTKGEVAFTYNYIFDQMVKKYAELEDEYDQKNLNSLKNIVEKITKEENFISVAENHNPMSSYMKFKMQKHQAIEN